MGSEEGGASSRIKSGEDPKNVEKDILRYYYYIHNGIDTEHVAPLENIRIQNTLGMKRKKLKKYINFYNWTIELLVS